MGGKCFGYETVSYTHLDVYKRQEELGSGILQPGLESFSRTGVLPVLRELVKFERDSLNHGKKAFYGRIPV